MKLLISVLAFVVGFSLSSFAADEAVQATQNQPNNVTNQSGDSFSVAQAKKRRKKRRRKKPGKKPAAKKKSWSRPYGMAGCGLGSVAFGADGSQVLAATTNGSTYTNLFGITTGTSNCVDGPMDSMAQRMDNFIQGNKVALASDMARGQGETIRNLSNIMGCQNPDRVGKVLQSNFEAVYTSERVKVNEVTDSVISVVIDDQELKGSCQNIRLS